jgi:hypothetical protein
LKEVGFAEQEYVDEHGMAEHAQHDCATAAEFQSTHVSIREVEEYQVGFSGVTVLELVINPYRWRSRASLKTSVCLDVVHGLLCEPGQQYVL